MSQPQEGSTRLRFRDTLNWPASKPIAVKELLKRLGTLNEELKKHDQERIEKASLKKVAGELASVQLLNHKDAGVKALTACCLVNVLQLCAPDAPFTANQLRDVYSLLVTQIIPALEDQSNPFHEQHVFVLESLATVKSILLLPDVQGSSNMIRILFGKCFDILSKPKDDVSKNVEYNITSLLECLIDEAPTLPQEAVDIILAQFLRADPRMAAIFSGAKVSKDSDQALPNVPPSYSVAKNLCNTCTVQMSRYVAQYFSAVIVDAASLDGSLKARADAGKKRKSMDEDEEEIQGPSEEDLKELQKVHRLLRELWKSAPAVLQNVIPQIDSELTTENDHLRLLATEAIGDMMAGIGAAGMPTVSQGDPAVYPPQDTSIPSDSLARLPEAFSRSHQATYARFLGRQKDKHAPIRAAWTLTIGRILVTKAGGIGLDPTEEAELISCLSQMLVDSDERVRIAAIHAIGLFPVNDVVSRLGVEGGFDKEASLLSRLGERVREKKHAVRVEAARLLGRVWASASHELAAGNTQFKDLLGAIPTKVFEAFYVNEKDVHVLIDEVLFEYFLPLSYPAIKKIEKAQSNGADDSPAVSRRNTRNGSSVEDPDWLRVERMLTLVSGMESRAKTVVLRLFARPVTLAPYVAVFVQRCEDWNGGVPDQKFKKEEVKAHLTRLVDFFASQTTDKQKSSEDLWKFIKLHDRRCYSLLKFCVSHESDHRKVILSMKEVKKRLKGSKEGQNASFMDTMSYFLERVSNLFYNKSHLQPIIKMSQNNQQELGAAAHDVLMDLTSKNPAVFKTHADEICRTLEAQAPSASEPNDPIALDGLKACATFAKKYPEGIPKDRKFQQAMMQYALQGTPPTAAKHAVTILMCSDKKDTHARELLKKSSELYEYGSDNFLSKLACLSQLMLIAGRDLEDYLDPVVDIAINQTLLQNRNAADAASDPSAYEWKDEADEECQAKCWALKILVNRVRSYESGDAARAVAKPVLQTLNLLVSKKGELSKRTKTPPEHKSRLRLQAGLLLLKLSTNKALEGFITPQYFTHLALLAQDELYQVREKLVRRAKKYLGQDRVPSRFYVIPMLIAFEPNTKLIRETETWLRARSHTLSKSSSRMTFEVVFARFLGLLAHHPDWELHPNDRGEFADYILFYLKTVATEENLGTIYHVAQRVKSIQDGIDVDKSENLYILSDLSQAVIRSYEETKNWSMQAFAGKIQMPAGIFAPLPSHTAAQEIATKTYLPSELADKVDEIVAASLKTKSKKRKPVGDGDPASRPPKSRRTTADGSRSKTSGPSVKKERKPAKSKKRHEFSDESEDDASSAVARSSPQLTSSVGRRRSGRSSLNKSYVEKDDDEDDADMDSWDQTSAVNTKIRAKAKASMAPSSEAEEEDEDEDMDKASAAADEDAEGPQSEQESMHIDSAPSAKPIESEDMEMAEDGDEQFDIPAEDSEKENATASKMPTRKKTAPMRKNVPAKKSVAKSKSTPAAPATAATSRPRRR